ncbi:alkaline shock response membrane anchor protein AmaP [Nocardiopsis sp. JB363]|uniref:alkaline shock response membrane anchor protein AmaP n=1 Tax=Nocardiopsis sp. JB363 TaxID=1434837 RepID=UPI001F394E82|nr:alkaline shock response membrane anchor protein AmaP [Nocardiopsis sp. JB363]
MVGVRSDTVPQQRVPVPRSESGSGSTRVRDPGGRVDISGSVIEKAAGRAAGEIAGARAARSRSARARVSGEVVLLRLRIDVDYPRSVGRVAGAVREHVKDQVERITGKQVHHIDIEIVELVR